MLAKCTKCHHEWQQVTGHEHPCDWCGAPGKKIATDYMDDPRWLDVIADVLQERGEEGK